MLPRPFLIPAVCALTALASACDDSSVRITSSRSENNDAAGVLHVVETLQCPQTLGSLTRKGSASEHGTVCTYNGPKGAEVVLHLVSLRGTDATTALKGFETQLSASLPLAVAQLQAAAQTQASGGGATASASTSSASTGDSASVRAPGVAIDANGDNASVRAPGVAIESQGEKASVRLPGVSIDADGDNASVRIGGFHINADGEGGAVDVSSGGEGGDAVSVRANQDAAVVRTNAAGPSTRSNWILTDNRDSAQGWRLVGYEARGPAGGPIVVATVRSKDREGGRVFDDAKELVTLNVGD